MTDDQAELLRDKYVLWERASREGPMDLRDYNRRAAEALKAALVECADAALSNSDAVTRRAKPEGPPDDRECSGMNKNKAPQP